LYLLFKFWTHQIYMHICRTTVSIILYLNPLYIHILSNENTTVFKHSSLKFL
jgi:hypothetical protein